MEVATLKLGDEAGKSAKIVGFPKWVVVVHFWLVVESGANFCAESRVSSFKREKEREPTTTA